MDAVMTDLFRLDEKVALVTGGSRGIGLMIARGLVQAGATVYISSRKSEACDKAAAELSKLGRCFPLPADLSTETEITRLVTALKQRETKLNVLVNNAATAWAAPLADYPAEAWDKILGLNVKSVFLLSRECLPLLKSGSRPRDPARIVNIGSIDGFRVPAFETYAYSASKAALHQLTRVLAQQLGPDNVTVNAIAPGTFPSKMTEEMFAQQGEALLRKSPLRRIGEPDDMAGISVFLTSRASAFITGQVIAVDGGLSTLPW
jgi:NAD(P)-dependent dehydrogenase (short-subunit alcohol dehydrogenase family)